MDITTWADFRVRRCPVDLGAITVEINKVTENGAYIHTIWAANIEASYPHGGIVKRRHYLDP